MKLILAVLPIMFSCSVAAATNPKWSFEFDEWDSNGKKHAGWSVKSKHPDQDITVAMRFIVLPEAEGMPNEWQFEYYFGPKAHHPKEMLWLTSRTNYDAELSEQRTRVGRSVVSKGLSSAYMYHFHRSWDEAKLVGNSERELTLSYKVPSEHDPAKKPWQQGVVNATFSMTGWEAAYRQLYKDVIAKGACICSKQPRYCNIGRLPICQPIRSNPQTMN